MFINNIREVYADARRSEKGEIASNLILMAGMALMAVVVTGMLARSITHAGAQTAACVENPNSSECKKPKTDNEAAKREAGKKEVRDRYKQKQ